MTPNRLRVVVVIGLLAAVVAAYLLLLVPPSLGRIAADPARFAGRTVTVKGTVETPTWEGFWLSDRTGRVYVVAPPGKSPVMLEGTLWQGRGVVKAGRPRPDGSVGAVIVLPQGE